MKRTILFSVIISFYSCSNRTNTEINRMPGKYQVASTASFSIPGNKDITKTESETVTVRKISNDSLLFQSTIFLDNPVKAAVVDDTAFILEETYFSGTTISGSGSIVNNHITMDILLKGFASTAVKMDGLKADK